METDRTWHLDGITRRLELPLTRESAHGTFLRAVWQWVESPCDGSCSRQPVVGGDGGDGTIRVGVLAVDESAGAIWKEQGLPPRERKWLLLKTRLRELRGARAESPLETAAVIGPHCVQQEQQRQQSQHA